jgi:hypothetical protein
MLLLQRIFNLSYPKIFLQDKSSGFLSLFQKNFNLLFIVFVSCVIKRCKTYLRSAGYRNEVDASDNLLIFFLFCLSGQQKRFTELFLKERCVELTTFRTIRSTFDNLG